VRALHLRFKCAANSASLRCRDSSCTWKRTPVIPFSHARERSSHQSHSVPRLPRRSPPRCSTTLILAKTDGNTSEVRSVHSRSPRRTYTFVSKQPPGVPYHPVHLPRPRRPCLYQRLPSLSGSPMQTSVHQSHWKGCRGAAAPQPARRKSSPPHSMGLSRLACDSPALTTSGVVSFH
jgi:hypothetical protein